MKTLKAVAVALFLLCAGVRLQAQTSAPQGAFPEATFRGEFSKNHANDPFYAWEAKMGFPNVTLYRGGRHSAHFFADFQTVGARMVNNRVNLAGTSYIVGLAYGHAFSDNVHFAGGFTHLSSHLAQDLVRITLFEQQLNAPIPTVNVAEDLNVFWGEARMRFPAIMFEPRVTVRIQPLKFNGFKFRSGVETYDKPVYIALEGTLWKNQHAKFVLASRHEIGEGGFNDFEGRLELFRQGRMQLFVAGSPGNKIRVGVNDGWHRDGLRTGIRFTFDAR